MQYIFMLLLTGILSACTTFPTEKVMKVHQGTSSKEILQMFGTPRNVSQAVCGSATGNPWTCTTWQYGEYGYGDRASFTFSGEPDDLILNDFSFDRNQ